MRLTLLYFNFLFIRILIIVYILLIPYVYNLLELPSFEIFNYLVHNPYYDEINSLPDWLYITKYLSIVFLTTIILILSLTFFYIINKKLVKRIHTKYNDILMTYLFDLLYDDTSNDIERREKLNRIKGCLKSDVTKRIFLNRLRRVHIQLTGEIKQRNLMLLNSLHYTSFIKAYLQSPLLRHNLFALRIISDFHLQGYEEMIYKLTFNRKRILKSEALVTLVKLYIYDDQLYLVDFRKKLSIWDINMIVSKIQQQTDININYSKVINSEIKEISIIGIILVRLNKLHKFKSLIKKKIESADSFVSNQALLTFISFATRNEDFEFLSYKFEVANRNTKLEIVKKITNPNVIWEKTSFLNWIVQNKSITLKIESIKALIKIDYSTYDEKFSNSTDLSIRNAYLHVKNLKN